MQRLPGSKEIKIVTQGSPRIVVIGGGAAGFFGAINCAENFPSAQVTILEATRRVLTKVRISGGGRCNVTHHCFDIAQLIKNYPRGAKELRSAFSRFQPADTIQWFERRGVALKVEADGRMFPTTDRSETIIQCLMDSAAQVGVKLELGRLVTSIEKVGGEFRIKIRGSDDILADAVLIATGSAAFGYDLSRSLGHTLEPLVPSLFTFNIQDRRLADLAGISFPQVKLELSIEGRKDTLKSAGPLLITHWGLSGPAVLKLSAFGAGLLKEAEYRARLSINFQPELNRAAIEQSLNSYKEQHAKRSVAKHSPLDVPKRFWQQICNHLEIPETKVYADLSKKTLASLTQEFTAAEYQVNGKGEFKDEFVTMGGVRLKEVDFRTMESLICPGLYFAGEVLDVDGVTGGFNFQNAWTTSFIAAQNMGRAASPAAAEPR